MFNPLHSGTNEEQYKKCKRKEATLHSRHESTPCAVSKDKWDTKEDTGKSMKHAL